MQRLALPSALVVAIATAAGCSGGNNNNNPAEGASTAPMPAAPAATTSAGSPMYNPANGASNAMAPGATTMAPAMPATASTSPMAGGTTGFAAEAARGGMLEVRLADLALQKSNDADVKSFANRMKTDHTAANEKLKSVVGSNEQLPTTLSAEQQQQVSSLESKSGKDFDKAYADTMVQDHQKDVSEFENAQNNAPTQDLRQFASQTLPTLKEHLKLAQQLQTKVGS
jgi:putative membrane protein